MNKPNPEQLEFLDGLLPITDTRCHDGFNGAMTECRLAYDLKNKRTICVHKTGWFTVQSNVSFGFAIHESKHSPYYRNFECNHYFRAFIPQGNCETF